MVNPLKYFAAKFLVGRYYLILVWFFPLFDCHDNATKVLSIFIILLADSDGSKELLRDRTSQLLLRLAKNPLEKLLANSFPILTKFHDNVEISWIISDNLSVVCSFRIWKKSWFSLAKKLSNYTILCKSRSPVYMLYFPCWQEAQDSLQWL